MSFWDIGLWASQKEDERTVVCNIQNSHAYVCPMIASVQDYEVDEMELRAQTSCLP